MSGSNLTVCEVRSTGNDLNGGGFVTDSGGVDYSQQDSPEATWSALEMTGTTTLEDVSGSGAFTTAMVGNLIQINGQFYQVVSYVDPDTVTVDRTDTFSGQSGRIGGALLTPGSLYDVQTTLLIDELTAYLKAGDYLVTTGTKGKGGPVANRVNFTFRIIGYKTARDDLAFDREIVESDMPRIYATGAISGGFLQTDSATFESNFITNIVFDMNDVASGLAPTGAEHLVVGCVFKRSTSYGFNGASISRCKAYDNAGHGVTSTTQVSQCISYDNGASGFNSCASVDSSLSYGNTDDGIVTGVNQKLVRCTVFGNGDSGIVINNRTRVESCISYGNNTSSGAGQYDIEGIGAGEFVVNCAYETIGDLDSDSHQYGNVVLTADPFTDSAGDDFTLNDVSGGGALCKASTQIDGTGSAYLGAFQPEPGGGGGSGIVRPQLRYLT